MYSRAPTILHVQFLFFKGQRRDLLFITLYRESRGKERESRGEVRRREGEKEDEGMSTRETGGAESERAREDNLV